MKRFSLYFLCVLFFSFSIPTHAQFFKKLGKKAEKSVQKRIDKRADKAVDKSLDKTEEGIDSAAKDATTTSDKDRERKQKRSKAGQEGTWPTGASNTSATELPENYTLSLSGSGPDLFLQYRMKMETQQKSAMSLDMNMKMYASISKGGGRSETSISMPMLGTRTMVTLTNFNDPTHVIQLNEKKRTYSILELGDGNSDQLHYTVKKLGTVELHGLKTVHSLVTSSKGQPIELWTTKEIPGYEAMLEIYSRSGKMGSNEMWKKMKAAGSEGFLVKIKSETKQGAVVLELVKVEKVSLPKSMFLVPNGYTQTENAGANSLLGR